MPKPLLKETPDTFSLAKIGADGVPREPQVRWTSDTLPGLTVFVATWHGTIRLDQAEARRFVRWLSGQVARDPWSPDVRGRSAVRSTARS
jgi:hypothetical protein